MAGSLGYCFALLINNGATFPNLVGKEDLNNTGFPNIGAGTFLSLPYTIWVMFILALIAVFLTTKTRFGSSILSDFEQFQRMEPKLALEARF